MTVLLEPVHGNARGGTRHSMYATNSGMQTMPGELGFYFSEKVFTSIYMLTTLLEVEYRVRGYLIGMFKIQEGFVSYGSDLFGRAGRTVAARSKPHRFTTNETDFFSQRVLRYWNSLPALVKASESVTSFKSRLDTFRLSNTCHC